MVLVQGKQTHQVSRLGGIRLTDAIASAIARQGANSRWLASSAQSNRNFCDVSASWRWSENVQMQHKAAQAAQQHLVCRTQAIIGAAGWTSRLHTCASVPLLMPHPNTDCGDFIAMRWRRHGRREQLHDL